MPKRKGKKGGGSKAKKAKTEAGAGKEKLSGLSAFAFKAGEKSVSKSDDVGSQMAGSNLGADDIGLSDILKEPWYGLLSKAITRQPNAEMFVGKKRPPEIFPVRELTFRALQANDPENYKVIIFGEAPFPRLESCTGIALFDGKFKNWAKLGRCASLRAMLKNICMWKDPKKIKCKSKADAVRKMAKTSGLVEVPEWFQATLAQGVLWLNTALTTGGTMSKADHHKFWSPVMVKIVSSILNSKAKTKKSKKNGCVFALWGRKAQRLKNMLSKISASSRCPVRFVEGWNPAAGGYGKIDFCDKDNLGMINNQLKQMGLDPINWFPCPGWELKVSTSQDHIQKAGAFIKETEELLRMYLDRLAGVGDENLKKLPSITGIMETKLRSLSQCCKPLYKIISFLEPVVEGALKFAERMGPQDGISKDQIAAVHLYTCGSSFYKKLNETLRDPNRQTVKAYFPYLRLLLSGFQTLLKQGKHVTLWRGVKLDLRSEYKKGGVITWWGVSSCTERRSVAEGFMGHKGVRMLFQVNAKAFSIKKFSAFSGEDEYVLRPGTQLQVTKVSSQNDGQVLVELKALDSDPLVG
mmetsp:Transcript_13809/g.21860  ORF Transcript_13809/g.21860 Transcript_13809/m.21860 type:complete len:580 (-) Transcript_13809:215-1954(-)